MTVLLGLWPAAVLTVVPLGVGGAVGLIVGSALDLRDEARTCLTNDRAGG